MLTARLVHTTGTHVAWPEPMQRPQQYATFTAPPHAAPPVDVGSWRRRGRLFLLHGLRRLLTQEHILIFLSLQVGAESDDRLESVLSEGLQHIIVLGSPPKVCSQLVN